jgi:F-type H+-transporting ATPase subunit delta
MEEIATVYARSLFEVATERDKLDDVRGQIGQFADALQDNHDLQVYFFSPYFSTEEKCDGLGNLLDGADEAVSNFLELLVEKHRMPVIFRMRRRFDEMWAEENRQLDVTLTSAVELDPEVVERVGAEIERQTDRKVQLRSQVDGDLLGGLVLQVGNMVLDASIRNRLERLRKEVAQAA